MLKNYTHISIVLDQSGSMNSIKQATMEGFNSFVLANNELPGITTHLLTLFNQDVEVGDLQTLKIQQLNDANYHPSSTTSLYDAIGKTINKTGLVLGNLPEDGRPDKVMFLIVTDGQENSSREFNQDQIFKMIKLQREQYSWEFVFMGANQDCYAVSDALYIPRGSTLNYGYNNRQAKQAWAGMTVNTMSYHTGDSNNMNFTDAQIKEQDGASQS